MFDVVIAIFSFCCPVLVACSTAPHYPPFTKFRPTSSAKQSHSATLKVFICMIYVFVLSLFLSFSPSCLPTTNILRGSAHFSLVPLRVSPCLKLPARVSSSGFLNLQKVQLALMLILLSVLSLLSPSEACWENWCWNWDRKSL